MSEQAVVMEIVIDDKLAKYAGGTELLILTERETNRFWSKVNKDGPLQDHGNYSNPAGPCWEWIAGKDGHGYGAFVFHGCAVKPHRLSWLIHRGQIPAGLCVLHRCDNPPCVHLFLGTKKDNSKDMSSKGRSGAHQHPDTLSRGDSHYSRTEPHRLARGERHGTVTKPETIHHGSTNGWSKLTESLALEIRAKYALGAHTHVSLARLYRVSKTTIGYIIQRKSWRHV